MKFIDHGKLINSEPTTPASPTNDIAPILRIGVPPKTEAINHKSKPINVTTKIAGAKALTNPRIKTKPAIS